MFELKLASGKLGQFENGAAMAEWFERMSPRLRKRKPVAKDKSSVSGGLIVKQGETKAYVMDDITTLAEASEEEVNE